MPPLTSDLRAAASQSSRPTAPSLRRRVRVGNGTGGPLVALLRRLALCVVMDAEYSLPPQAGAGAANTGRSECAQKRMGYQTLPANPYVMVGEEGFEVITEADKHFRPLGHADTA